MSSKSARDAICGVALSGTGGIIGELARLSKQDSLTDTPEHGKVGSLECVENPVREALIRNKGVAFTAARLFHLLAQNQDRIPMYQIHLPVNLLGLLKEEEFMKLYGGMMY